MTGLSTVLLQSNKSNDPLGHSLCLLSLFLYPPLQGLVTENTIPKRTLVLKEMRQAASKVSDGGHSAS